MCTTRRNHNVTDGTDLVIVISFGGSRICRGYWRKKPSLPVLSEWNHFWMNECWIQKDDDVHGVSRRWKSWSLPSNHWFYWLVQLENEPCQWLYLGLNCATVLASRICLASGDYNSDIFWSSSVSCLVKSCGKPARKSPCSIGNSQLKNGQCVSPACCGVVSFNNPPRWESPSIQEDSVLCRLLEWLIHWNIPWINLMNNLVQTTCIFSVFNIINIHQPNCMGVVHPNDFQAWSRFSEVTKNLSGPLQSTYTSAQQLLRHHSYNLPFL